jgi:hypothetical protein
MKISHIKKFIRIFHFTVILLRMLKYDTCRYEILLYLHIFHTFLMYVENVFGI